MHCKKYIIEIDNCYEKTKDGLFVLKPSDINDLVYKMIEKKPEIDSSIRFLKLHGETVVVVDYGDLIDLDKFSRSSQRMVIAKFIKALFRYSEIYTIDNIRITTSHNSLKKLTNAVRKEHFNILLFSDCLVQTAKYKRSKADVKGRRMEYRYYDAFLSLDSENIFSMQLNIRIDHMGATLYDINKIKKSGWTVRLGKPGTL